MGHDSSASSPSLVQLQCKGNGIIQLAKSALPQKDSLQIRDPLIGRQGPPVCLSNSPLWSIFQS